MKFNKTSSLASVQSLGSSNLIRTDFIIILSVMARAVFRSICSNNSLLCLLTEQKNKHQSLLMIYFFFFSNLGGINICSRFKSIKKQTAELVILNTQEVFPLTRNLPNRLVIVTGTNKRTFVQDQPCQVTYACQKDRQLQLITRTRLQSYLRCYHLMLAFGKVTVNLYFNLFFCLLKVE